MCCGKRRAGTTAPTNCGGSSKSRCTAMTDLNQFFQRLRNYHGIAAVGHGLYRVLMVKYPGLPSLSPEIYALEVSGFDPAQLLKTFQFVQFFRRRQEGQSAGNTKLCYRNICMLLHTYIACLDRC
jgi:hypothetical protein